VIRIRSARPALLAAVLLAACASVPSQTPNPEAIPSGSLEAQGGDATGPVVELGSGQQLGIGWRYAIYPVADGWCTQLETAAVTAGSCGDLLPSGDAAIGTVGEVRSDSDTVLAIEGVVSADAFTVWLIEDASQRRFPATLMPLEPAGLEATAFLGFPPDGMTVTHVQALARSGEVLETLELP
jgi:hypothetical protein